MSKIQTTMKGYKVFNSNWRCKDMQYEVGKTYEMEESPVICKRGFHFCKKLIDCFNYYEFDSKNKVAEIEAYGELDFDGEDKHCTNKIRIVKELSWYEVLDVVNTGRDCTGLGNVGNDNSGNLNSGDRNTGNGNSGNGNSGIRNSGNCNSGSRNSGGRNTGYYNSGDLNSGDNNSGSRNSGFGNSGNLNSGNRNIGNGNVGDWNYASNCVGCFNTIDQPIMFFDKPSNMTLGEWRNSEAYWLLGKIDFRPVHWVFPEGMTDDEKKNHPEYEITGGYLSTRTEEERMEKAIDAWENLTAEEKQTIKGIPNFDAKKFSMIMGIPVELIEG